MKYFLFLFFLILAACRKDVVDNTKDYRETFIGNYTCHVTGAYGCMLDTNIIRYDTIVLVNITKYGDSSIFILNAILKINNNGEFGGGLYPGPAYHGFGGYFINDSIFFTTYQGGLGCHTILNYNGKIL